MMKYLPVYVLYIYGHALPPAGRVGTFTSLTTTDFGKRCLSWICIDFILVAFDEETLI